MTYEQNIKQVYDRASDTDIITGKNWYQSAYDSAVHIAKGDASKGAGVIAAFSPLMAWKLNLELAASCTRSNRFTGHFSANNRKARAIWNGKSPLAVLGGNKVRSFYENIVTAGRCDNPCIDRHAIAIALDRLDLTDRERQQYGRGTRYDAIANAYRNVAKQVGLTASELQAITWVTWRREKGIVD